MVNNTNIVNNGTDSKLNHHEPTNPYIYVIICIIFLFMFIYVIHVFILSKYPQHQQSKVTNLKMIKKRKFRKLFKANKVSIKAHSEKNKKSEISDLISDKILGERYNTRISESDINSLEPRKWITDNIIDFFFKYLADPFPDIYIFPSYFYTLLVSSGNYQNVKGFTSKISIFNYRRILIPIIDNSHWTMVQIDFQAKKIDYLNSFHQPNNSHTDAILQYLVDEHLDKKGYEKNYQDFQIDFRTDIPKQTNSYDCGIFVMKYAECLVNDQLMNFTEEMMPFYRQKITSLIKSKLLPIS